MKRPEVVRMLLIGGALLAVLAGPAHAQNQTSHDRAVARAEQSFRAAYGARNWTQAVQAGLQLTELLPASDQHAYNLACAYAQGGDPESALNWLGRAVANGFINLRRMQTDPALAALRRDPGYAAVVNLVKENRKKHLAEVLQMARARRPIILAPRDHDAQTPAPVIVALHGAGARPESIIVQWRDLAAEHGAILIAPRALQPVEGTLGGAWGEADEAELIVNEALEFAKKRFKIDDSRIVLTGFSQGAHIAAALGARNAARYRGVIPIGGSYLPELDQPERASGERRPRFCFLVGALDRAVAENRQAAEDFEKAGYEVKLDVYPDVGHEFPKSRGQELRDALEFVLGD